MHFTTLQLVRRERDSDISSEMGVQGASSPAGVLGVRALSPSPPSGLQARQINYEERSVM